MAHAPHLVGRAIRSISLNARQRAWYQPAVRHLPGMRRIPLWQRSQFSALFFLQHWFPGSDLVRRGKEAARRRVVASVRGGGIARVLEIERRRDLSPEEFREGYLRRGIPVILEGAGRSWKCTREWSFENFRRRFGGESIKLVQRKGVAPDDELVDGREFSEEILFSEFLDQVLRHGRKYMRFSPLLEQFPELLDDFDQDFLQGMPGNSWGTTYTMFIGAPGTFTPLHNTITPFFFVNICGVKRWQFIPQAFMAVLDPPPDGLTYNHSAADVSFSNLDRYPGFDCVDRLEAVMQPGDVLFNPSWMWHCVQNEAPTIGVRCGFIYPRSMVAESLTLACVRAFAGNPSMLKTAWYSFVKTNLPSRDKLLITPKVFTRQPIARQAPRD
jgi:hypothetical protein